MTSIKVFASALLAGFVILVVGEQSNRYADELNESLVVSGIDVKYYKEASAISNYFYRHNSAVDAHVVVETLKTIDRLLPEYFPNGAFRRNDLIAIAMLESNFNQYERGTAGEFGLFQIMPVEFLKDGVRDGQYEIPVNTRYAFTVLKRKFRTHRDYKKAIIAYNGVVRDKKTGKWSERYWRAFLIRHDILDDLFKDLN